MSINLEKQDKFALLKVEENKLTSVNAPELKTHFTALHAEGMRNVILELSQVDYCDSSGLSAILAGNRFCKQLGGTFVICMVKEPVCIWTRWNGIC
jgi:anti-sigma B factor antagonist